MNNRHGFTLIELVISIAIGMIVVSICTNLCANCISKYNCYIEETNNMNELEEVIINISRILREEHVKNIYSMDNKIITNTAEDSYEIIYRNNNKICIDYVTFYANRLNKTTTKVIGEIEDFQVVNKDRLIYITIKKGKFSISRCL
ncbi:prepilin-type N-terminal cleavage/methylation domain-containing protein [Clostridium sp. MSJ-8]|uniref:prepilin-type N-terminal cleavage/methylation domain-containing protein n=1 Tax=Clostridium sp. MSJ-8 TaxID=2841510 RepID=UPI001C0EED08|nr:prepilin-type N-terminal cleavage/methylation domain-containing protein [Clostridium sp. MSJ-8]MBU5487544.1 prepilin-type N-terminal cleavage/methylation domain-containing protein [Clostridium sp. MSJ-8]